MRGRFKPSLPFRAADHLRSKEAITKYLNAALEDGNPRVTTLTAVLKALGYGLAIKPVWTTELLPATSR